MLESVMGIKQVPSLETGTDIGWLSIIYQFLYLDFIFIINYLVNLNNLVR